MKIIKLLTQLTCNHRFRRIGVCKTKGKTINVYQCDKCKIRWEEIKNENISK